MRLTSESPRLAPPLMNPMKPLSLATLVDAMTQVRKQGAPSLLTNYFGKLHSPDPFPACVTRDAVLFLDADRDFQHLLFTAASPAALDSALKNCPPGIYASDYITRSFDQEWEDAFLRNGFTRRATYQRIASTLPKIPAVKSETEFAREDEAEALFKLLPEVFDRYLDHLASLEEIREMLRDRRVIVNRIHGEIAGFFVIQIQGQRAHLNHWYNPPETGPNAGLELLIRAYHEMAARGVKFVHGWVNVTNQRVFRIHRLFGLVPDGLWHYNYFRNDHAQSI